MESYRDRKRQKRQKERQFTRTVIQEKAFSSPLSGSFFIGLFILCLFLNMKLDLYLKKYMHWQWSQKEYLEG